MFRNSIITVATVLAVILAVGVRYYISEAHRIGQEEAALLARGCSLMGEPGEDTVIEPGITVRGPHWICKHKEPQP